MKGSDIKVGEIYAICGSSFGWSHKHISIYTERARVIETEVESDRYTLTGRRVGKKILIQRLGRDSNETIGREQLVPPGHVRMPWSEFLVVLEQEEKAREEADLERKALIAERREERDRLIIDIEGWMGMPIKAQSEFPALSRLDDTTYQGDLHDEVKVPVSELHRIIKHAFEQGLFATHTKRTDDQEKNQ